MRFDCGGDKRTERLLQGLCEVYAVFAPCHAVCGSDKFDKQFSAVADLNIHLSACAEFERQSRCGVDVADFGIRSPFDRHLNGFVDEINFTMERRFAACCTVQKFANLGNVFGFKCIPTRTEKVESLTVHKENRFLTFMNDELS